MDRSRAEVLEFPPCWPSCPLPRTPWPPLPRGAEAKDTERRGRGRALPLMALSGSDLTRRRIDPTSIQVRETKMAKQVLVDGVHMCKTIAAAAGFVNISDRRLSQMLKEAGGAEVEYAGHTFRFADSPAETGPKSLVLDGGALDREIEECGRELNELDGRMARVNERLKHLEVIRNALAKLEEMGHGLDIPAAPQPEIMTHAVDPSNIAPNSVDSSMVREPAGVERDVLARERILIDDVPFDDVSLACDEWDWDEDELLNALAEGRTEFDGKSIAVENDELEEERTQSSSA